LILKNNTHINTKGGWGVAYLFRNTYSSDLVLVNSSSDKMYAVNIFFFQVLLANKRIRIYTAPDLTTYMYMTCHFRSVIGDIKRK
jgi:hypothetical protein